MNDIPMKHTIELMKNKNQLQHKVVEFIKNADLYMDNFEYVDMDKIQRDVGEDNDKPEEKVSIFQRILWIRSGLFLPIKVSMCPVCCLIHRNQKNCGDCKLCD